MTTKKGGGSCGANASTNATLTGGNNITTVSYKGGTYTLHTGPNNDKYINVEGEKRYINKKNLKK